MLHYRKAIGIFRRLSDIVVLFLSFWFAVHIRSGNFAAPLRDLDIFVFVFILFLWFLSAKFNGLYDEFRSRNFGFEVIIVIREVLFLTIGMIIVLFILRDKKLSRIFISTFAIFVLFIDVLVRLIFRVVLVSWRKKGRNLRNMIIVGSGKLGLDFCNLIEDNPTFGYKVIGFADDKFNPQIKEKFLGKIDDLDSILSTEEIDIVLIALPNSHPERIGEVIDVCEKHTTRIKIVPDYFRFVSGKYDVSMFGKFPVISVRQDRINETHWRLIKRIFDLIFSIIISATIFIWLFPFIAIAIKIDSRGPVFFRQERWGRSNKKFRVYKFRTMVNSSVDVDENGKYLQATKSDPRITPVGKFLRRTNLDEMPQFFNVLKGDMSVVGPRPHPTPLNIESRNKFHLYMFRHIVKPGITGWAQINGFRGETSDPKMMKQRIEHDVWYIENWSLWLDIQIIIITIYNMLKGDDSAY